MSAEQNTEKPVPTEKAPTDASARLRDAVQADSKLTAPISDSKFLQDHPSLPKLELLKTDSKILGQDATHTQALDTLAAKGVRPEAEIAPKTEDAKIAPKETIDKDGNKTTDFGGGHIKVENKDGSGYERFQDKDGSFHEEHFGKNSEDKFTVTGDKDGNKKTDWHNGHTKVENADGTGFERSESADGRYTETHFGPKNDYTVVGDKNGKLIDYHDGHQSYQGVDGKGWERLKAADGSAIELHHGPAKDDNFSVKDDGKGNKTTDWGNGHVKVENADGTHYEQTVDLNGNKWTEWSDGRVRVDNKDGTGYEHFPGKGKASDEIHWGPKPEDNYSVSVNEKGDKTTDYGNGHTLSETADGKRSEKWLKEDGSYKEEHSGPKPEDKYSVEKKADGTVTTDFGGGHIKVENKDGSGYEQFKKEDGSSLEKHFGKEPKDNYSLTTDKDGNKTYDWGDGHTRVENKDQTGYDRTKNSDGSYTEKHFGPKESDNYRVTEDKDGKRETHRLTEQQEKDGAVRRGEGPYQVAQRLLGGNKASHNEIMALVRAMQAEYKLNHPHDPHMRGLKVGEPLLNSGNLQKILDHLPKNSPLTKHIQSVLHA